MSESDLRSFSNDSESDVYGGSEPSTQSTDPHSDVNPPTSDMVALLREQLSDLKIKYEENTSLKVAMKDFEALFAKTDEICLNQALKIEDLKKSEQEKIKEIRELKERISVQSIVINDLEEANSASKATISSLNCQARLKYEDEQKLKATIDSLQKRNKERASWSVQQFKAHKRAERKQMEAEMIRDSINLEYRMRTSTPWEKF